MTFDNAGPMPHQEAPSVRLISHASVVMQVGGVAILTDPWFFGKAFNESWGLIGEPADVDFDRIDYLWISHEHPDHFHIPTLKTLPGDFKERVTVLFQRSSDCGKMVAALGRLGFPNVRLLPHRQWVDLEGKVEVLCYQSRQIDSALALRGPSGVILNLNDCPFGARDLGALKELAGSPDILLNQFSVAGFDGVEEGLPAQAAAILDDMVDAHRALGAGATVPFASFAYFCREDNRFINAHANTPRAVAERFATEGLRVAVLRPGDRFTAGAAHDNGEALAFHDRQFQSIPTRLPAQERPVPLGTLAAAAADRSGKLRAMHGWAAWLLRPLAIRIPDLGCTVKLALAKGRMTPTDQAPDLSINSQPLLFLLSNDFGSQTLGVSGCYRLHANARRWMVHRALMAMLNAGIGLSPRRVLSPSQMSFFWRRRGDILHQVGTHLRRTLKRARAASLHTRRKMVRM